MQIVQTLGVTKMEKTRKKVSIVTWMYIIWAYKWYTYRLHCWWPLWSRWGLYDMISICGAYSKCNSHRHWGFNVYGNSYMHWTALVERNYLSGCCINWSLSQLYRDAISWDIACLFSCHGISSILRSLLPGQVYLWRSSVLIQCTWRRFLYALACADSAVKSMT